jgi:creatine kinase
MSAIDKVKDLADFKAAYTLDELECTATVGKCEEWIKKGCGVNDYIHTAGEIAANYPRTCPAEALPDLAGHNSFVTDEIKKNPALFDELKDKKTAGGVSLADCIKTGIDNKGHPNIKPVGMVAGDEESYTLFAALFDPVIDARHGGFKSDAKHVSDMNTDNIVKTDMDPSGEYVKTSRVRTGRSVRGYNLPPCNSFEERRKLEKAIVDALMTLKGDLAGAYFPLHGSNSNPCGDMAEGMTHDKEKDLLSRGNLFQEPDSTLLLSGGMGRHWPDARGIYHNEGQNLFVWLNEEDHMRIVSMQKGRDMGEVAARFMRACNEVEATGLKFMQNDHLGWILTCPSNLGTGLRAGCQVSLKELNAHLKDHANANLKWKAALAHMGLQARGVGGVDVVGTDVFDISNADRLGKSETRLVNIFIDGVSTFIQWEQKLEKGEPIDDDIKAKQEAYAAA